MNKYERCRLKPEGKECVGGHPGHADCCIPYEPWDADAYFRFVTKADRRWSVLATICRELHFDYEDGPEKAVETIRAAMARIEEQKAELLDSAATIRQLTRVVEQQADSVREAHAANEELARELTARHVALTESHADNEAITAMNKELAGKVAALREELERSIRTGFSYANEVNQLKVDLDRAENNGEAATRHAGKQAEEIAELRSKLEHVRHNRDALRSACSEVANERNDLQKKLGLAEAKLVMATRLEENLQAKLVAAYATIGMRERYIETLDNALDSRNRRIESMKRAMDALNTRIDQAVAEAAQLRTQEAPPTIHMTAEVVEQIRKAVAACEPAKAAPENHPLDSLHRIMYYNAEGLRCKSYLPNAPAPLLEHIRPVVVSIALVDPRTRERLGELCKGGQQKPPTVNDPETIVGTIRYERAGRALGKSTALGDDILEPGPNPINTLSQPGYVVGQRCNRDSCHGILRLSYGIRQCPVCAWNGAI